MHENLVEGESMDRKIKINDRVRLINPSYETKRDYPSLLEGDEGIVVDILPEIKLDPKDLTWNNSGKNCRIDWGKPVNGHDCGGRCQDGHGSSVEREEIEVL